VELPGIGMKEGMCRVRVSDAARYQKFGKDLGQTRRLRQGRGLLGVCGRKHPSLSGVGTDRCGSAGDRAPAAH
jgi:hypothetical protein